ncbi:MULTISPECIES: hypothetical protein [Pseudonocardia]|uniref:Uncharacterized protein n=2 Tax=Pseudonocardia TaxID=1847 RepID=A0A1Y2N549_PSEAH|nr:MULTISPECIES: hypothetical protein [Pseudonocardia]OSY42048.1 hypothetical protein BG845_01544 [Pseudonocardia autotrophica]TDN75183.1 hypothetical protein C8E95_4327 [Pseudonocardia autotrophica]BBF99128.1 hypothetical protein Pdca_03380 [Pseudonocardia autotrophica]GEC24048.1 hypothetical protein PSA01_10770 [Pseudonocardia saturnea]
MTTYLVAGGGLVLMLWFALLIGTSLDTEGQRREWRRVAEQRRAAREERQGERRPLEPDDLCADCPLRR